tara:strand:+ start:9841 stop:10419 length:579 start_codon:yes stop_codon:yes gene_type:complete
MLEEPALVLASKSPRRKELLREITVNFEVLPSLVDEKIHHDLTAEENVRLLSRGKTLDVAKKRKNAFVVGADTLVVCGKEIMGKPVDIEDAKRILRFLSGKTHEVITGIAVVAPDGKCLDLAVKSSVTFKILSNKEIGCYVETGEPMDKAGAYAIQGEGRRLIAFHEGSWSNIVGLPMERLRELLAQQGYPV